MSDLVSTTLWFIGRPCCGKSAIAAELKKVLGSKKVPTTQLDGDVVRAKMNADLGFSPKDRQENLRRAAHVAQLFNENDRFVLASFVTPTDELRKLIRGIVKNLKFCYVRCSLKECERRDVKGMYKKARAGVIKDFTGIDAPFEEPTDADIVVDTETQNLEDCVKVILKALDR